MPCVSYDYYLLGAEWWVISLRLISQLDRNYGIIRMWIRQLNFAQKSIFQAWGTLTSLKSQTWDPQLKVPPGGLVLKKSIDLSQVSTCEPWILRQTHYPETTEADKLSSIPRISSLEYHKQHSVLITAEDAQHKVKHHYDIFFNIRNTYVT